MSGRPRHAALLRTCQRLDREVVACKQALDELYRDWQRTAPEHIRDGAAVFVAGHRLMTDRELRNWRADNRESLDWLTVQQAALMEAGQQRREALERIGYAAKSRALAAMVGDETACFARITHMPAQSLAEALAQIQALLYLSVAPDLDEDTCAALESVEAVLALTVGVRAVSS